jgi:hypothetical protein
MARTDQPHKLTFDTFVSRATDFSDPKNEKHRTIDYGKPETRAQFNGRYVKVPLWCTVHEEFFEQAPGNHLSLGQGCPKCGKTVYKEKRRKADPVADFRKVHGDIYDYSRVVYENVHTPVEIVCPTHGVFWQKPNSHLTGQGCPHCWENRRKAFGAAKTADYKDNFAERAARIHKGAYAVVVPPEHSHDDVVLNCPKHGDFTQKAFSHLDGHGCPTCGKTTSYAQLDLAEFVASLGVEVVHEDRKVLKGREIDIWVPSHNIGIEYHGLHWHTEDRIGDTHKAKYDLAEAAGIRLIQIYDYEWLERRPAVENRLRSMFSSDAAIGARACEVREVSGGDANRFFAEHHTQGRGQNPIAAYGLYHENLLVACASFGTARYGHEGWELLRFATVGRVQGALGRLLAKFREVKSPESILSYCDLRWGNGTVYERNGFVLDGITVPDYFYVGPNGSRIPRYSARERPQGMTESAWAASKGYRKVVGVGHQRWVLTRKASPSH